MLNFSFKSKLAIVFCLLLVAKCQGHDDHFDLGDFMNNEESDDMFGLGGFNLFGQDDGGWGDLIDFGDDDLASIWEDIGGNDDDGPHDFYDDHHDDNEDHNDDDNNHDDDDDNNYDDDDDH